MANGMSWAQGNRLIAQLGSEANLARRIARERAKRDWSQAELARELADHGCSIPQSAISKIENPTVEGMRRDVTVDEAIAFAQVFDIPLGELFLPDGEVEALEVAAMIQLAGKALEQYEEQVAELARRSVRQPEIRAMLDGYRDGSPISIPAFAFPVTPRSNVKRVLRDVDLAVDRIEQRAPGRVARKRATPRETE